MFRSIHVTLLWLFGSAAEFLHFCVVVLFALPLNFVSTFAFLKRGHCNFAGGDLFVAAGAAALAFVVMLGATTICWREGCAAAGRSAALFEAGPPASLLPFTRRKVQTVVTAGIGRR